MAVSAFFKFNCFVEDIAEKKHDLGTDALKVMLTNTLPVATNTVRTDVTDLTTAGGYTNGGAAVPAGRTSTQTSGTYKLVLPDVVFTATGAVGPFRYAVLYNTVGTAPLIGWWDNGTSISLANGESFTVEQVDGVFYESKSAFRAVGKKLGLIEVGNEKFKPRIRPSASKEHEEGRVHSIKKAMERVRSGDRANNRK
jgi:hypothetical protein